MGESDPVAGLLDPAGSVLLIVDVQNDYCHPDGVLGTAGLDMSMVDPMCEVIERLRDAARRAGVPTILLRTVHAEATDSAAWLRRTAYSASLCREGSWGSQFYRIQPGTDDVVVIKHRYSGFVGTRLEQVLNALERTSLVVTGTATEVCVESTVRDARMRDFDPLLVRDALASSDVKAHEGSLEVVGRFFGRVLDSAQVMRAWEPVTDPGVRRVASPVPTPPLPLNQQQRRWMDTAERHVDPDRLRELLVHMVGTPSPTGGEGALAELLADELSGAGVEARVQRLDDLQASAIGRVAGDGQGPRFLLYAPIDTHTDGVAERDLPWAGEQLRGDMTTSATLINAHVVGLGANNPKGHAACVIAAAEAVAAAGIPLRGDLVVGLGAGGMPALPRADDPLGRSVIGHGHGCARLLDEVGPVDFALIAKPGPPLWEEVGLAIIRVSVHGDLDYAGVRHLGEHRNPIVAAAKVVAGLERWFAEYTFRNTSVTVAPQGSIGAIRAGWAEKPTFSPARCDLFVDLRISPRMSVDAALRQFGAAVGRIADRVPEAGVDWQVLAAEPGGVTEPDSWVVTSCVRAWGSVENRVYSAPAQKSGATDAAILRKMGVPTVRVGMSRAAGDLPFPDDFSRGMNAVAIASMVNLTRVLIRCVVDTCTRTREELALPAALGPGIDR